MKYILTLLAVIVAALLFTQCRTTKTAVTNNENHHGEEKALTGEQFQEKKDFILKFDLTDNNLPVREISMRCRSGYYDAYYKRDGDANVRLLDDRGAKELVDVLTHIDMSTYYRENTSNSKDISNEWTLNVDQEGSNFQMHGVNVNPEDYPIVKNIISFYDYLFEYNESNTPFATGKLVYFHYAIRGSMRPGGPAWEVNAMPDGKYKFTYTDDRPTFQGKPEEVKEIICDASLGDEMYNFMKEGRVQDYRSDYYAVGVQDGSSWSFSARFSDGKSYRSSGYMDGPRDMSGVNNCLDLLNKLLKEE